MIVTYALNKCLLNTINYENMMLYSWHTTELSSVLFTQLTLKMHYVVRPRAMFTSVISSCTKLKTRTSIGDTQDGFCNK